MAHVKLFKRRHVAFSSRDGQGEIGIWRWFRFRRDRKATVHTWEDFAISHVVVFSKRGAKKSGEKPLIFTIVLQLFAGF